MPMVKYGIVAWAVLVWTFLSSLTPIRGAVYEFFVLQHITSAVVFLWLVRVHVPKYSYYFIWMLVGAVSFDWVFRALLLLYRNIYRGGFGYRVRLGATDKDITVLALENVPFSWKPGQHIRLWIPRLGILESHPYTMATPSTFTGRGFTSMVQLVIHTSSGTSKRINTYARRPKANLRPKPRAFISGPYGTPPQWNAHETLILMAASTGVSFTLPILLSIINDPLPSGVKRIRFLLVSPIFDASQWTSMF